MSNAFKKKLMHPTRKKLADMVVTGEYDKNTTIGGFSEKTIHREIGDVWEDEHYRYEKKEGYIMKEGKNSQIYQDIRKYLEESQKCKGKECTKHKYSRPDKKMIKKIGYCIDCNAEIETQFASLGLLTEYRDYRIYTRALIYGKMMIENLKQSRDTAKQVYEYVNSDGTTNKWELPKPVDEVKREMQEIIDNSEAETKIIEEKRNRAFEKLKDYEHLL